MGSFYTTSRKASAAFFECGPGYLAQGGLSWLRVLGTGF